MGGGRKSASGGRKEGPKVEYETTKWNGPKVEWKQRERKKLHVILVAITREIYVSGSLVEGVVGNVCSGGDADGGINECECEKCTV